MTSNSINWTSKRFSKHVIKAEIPIQRNKDWEWWMLITSDHHIDSPYCDRELLKRHLQEAKERGAGIHCNGDIFDVMQAAGDKRQSKRELMQEYLEHEENGDPRSYLDRIVDDAVNFYSPYSKNLICISEGNHEDSIASKCGTNLIYDLTKDLRKDHGSPVTPGAYSGYIKLAFADGKYKDGRKRYNGGVLIHYHHGYGGGNGKIAQRAAMFPDADICVSGHTHDHEVGKEWGQERVTPEGATYIKNQTHIILGTYKNESESGRSYAVKKFHKHKVLGAVWVRFYYNWVTERVDWQTMQAR